MSRNARWSAPASRTSWCAMTARPPWLTNFARPPAEWSPADLHRDDAHRARLERLIDAVRPRYLMRGHLHRSYQRDCNFGFGPVRFTGPAADGTLQNFAVLDVASMAWGLSRRGLLGRKAWF